MSADTQPPTPSNQAIYFAALKLSNPRERKAFLDVACGNDSIRRESIERLLAVGEPPENSPLDRVIDQLEPDETRAEDPVSLQSGSLSLSNGELLVRPWDPSLDSLLQATADETTTDTASRDHPTIDCYKLLEHIGEGGMGTVFMAQQTAPIQRRVALKLIKPGMDSREVIVRFEAERQTLAMMDHPNIARVLDAGTTEAGRPYFVMELVRGVPITKYCDQERLSIPARLRLFIDVCRAVQHAHQKGIIHRDIKPNNVMVTLHDGVPVVKVIDFGVAKALNQELTEQTLFTHFAQMIGTPLYMSPEQAEMSGLDIDTRSDVYSLGVMLYELLTGTTPFDRETLSKAGFDGMRRIICEEEPARPSHKLSTLKAELLSTVADRRVSAPRQLSLSMKRELDWIAVKALEKDRSRRYESASALAADLERYLDDEPVQACPPSTFYRLRKVTRRYRGLIAAAAVTLCLMLIGLVVSSQLAFRAKRAEQVALAAQETAELTTEAMRNLLYASDVLLASKDWRNNDVQQARERLSRHIPQPGQRDLRGFEWHHLWKQQAVEGVDIANFGSEIYDIALSPDGKLIAGTGESAVIHVFDIDTYAPRTTIATQQGETNGIAFSPDSSRIAATGDDGTLRLWELETARELWTTHAHAGKAYQVRFSPDGNSLVTCGEDKLVRLWDVSNGSALRTLNEHKSDIEAIDVSATGIVAAGDRKRLLTLWDLQQGKAVWAADDAKSDPISAVAFSDGGYLAQASLRGQLMIMDFQRQTVVSQRRLDAGIQSLAFAPGGSWLVIGDRAGHLRMVNFEHGSWDLRSTREWPAHAGRVYAVKVTADGKQIFSGGTDGRLVAWGPRMGTPDQVLNYPDRHWSIKSLDGGRMLLAGHQRTILSDRAGQPLQAWGPPGYWGIDVRMGLGLMYGWNDHEFSVWNTDTLEQVLKWPQLAQSRNFTYCATPDGQLICRVAKHGEGPSRLEIFDVRSKRFVAQLPVKSANQLVISSDSRWLVFDSNNDLELYDLKQHKSVATWKGHHGAIRRLQFSHDGMRLGSVSEDRTLKLWSVPSGELLYSVIAHRTETERLAFSPDDRRIATGGTDRMLRIWDGVRSEPLWEYPVAEGRIVDLCFSRDGQQLLCLSNFQHVLILDGSPIP